MMDTGMLWYDDDKKRTMDEKIRRAVDYYQEKYGRMPNLCLINPNLAANGDGQTLEMIELRTANNVLPHHFWVGIDNGAK